MDIEIAPLIASAGIAGLAIGFGAQALIRDILGGLFILLENQFDIGDVIRVNSIAGAAEKMSLRATYLRDLEGTLHLIPNGDIRIVSNLTRTWSRVVVDVGIAYESPVERALEIMREVGREIQDTPEFSPLILEEPVVTGVESLGAYMVTLRLMIKVAAGKQWQIKRTLQQKIKARFEAEGVQIPYPIQRIITQPNQGEQIATAE